MVLYIEWYNGIHIAFLGVIQISIPMLKTFFEMSYVFSTISPLHFPTVN